MLNLQQISKTDTVLLPTLLKSIEDNRVFKKSEYRESFIKNINNLLSLRESRYSALLTLNIFCDHHSVVNSPLVTEKTCPEINWIEQLLRIIEQEQQFHSECFEILGKLLRVTSCNPDTNKLVQSKYVQKIIDAIVGSKVSPVQSLNCLAICFELHGGTSGIYKNKSYDYCASFVDVPDNAIAEHAALCLHLLQQSRGGSVAGGVYKKCWAEFHEKTVGSLEVILEQILKKGGGGNIGKSEQLQLPELKLSPEPFNMYTRLFVRFQNVTTILRVALERPFSTAKIVQVSRILTLIEDGIAMSQALIGKKAISENMVLSLLHGQVHSNLLDILVTLIKQIGQNIITHSKTVCDILWRCLKQTSSQEQLKFEANLKLRVATYEAFKVFMSVSSNNFYVKNVMENLMKEALIDVTPANNEICLMMPQQNVGKSKKRKKVNAEKFAKGRVHVANISDEQKVCAKALECLGSLLVHQGVLMKPVLFYILQEKLISIGFKISSHPCREGDLYRDPNCRSRLADVIGYLMLYPVYKMPVPINYGIALLTKLKNSDPDLNVRHAAELNLHHAEKAVHNRKDVFYYPIDFRDLRDTLMFNKQTVIKFNESTAVHQEITNELKAVEQLESNESKTNEAENIVISDNESGEDEVAVVETTELVSKSLDPPQDQQPEVNEISDDDDDQGEPQEISDDESVEETAIKPPAVKEKRPSSSDEAKVIVKKQKVASKKDEEVLEEYLADFVDELVSVFKKKQFYNKF